MRKNPTSAIRRGFTYQDIWGLLLCANFLREPDKYKWIRFETIPDDINDNKFYLDDIILCDNVGDLHAYQIKRAQASQDKWDWRDLLKKEKKKDGSLKDSLIQKWFNSYQKSENVIHGYFITNRSASNKIKNCLIDNKISLEKVEKLYPDIFQKLIDQLGTKKDMANYFFNFEFRFNQPDKDEIENNARKILQEGLGATDEGILSLKDWIRDESDKSITKPLTIRQLRTWCDWDMPRQLNQRFEIPEDFVLFDESIHKEVLKSVKNPEGGVQVFFGKPGTGKSTYLSELFRLLRDEGVIIIRHHYHISPDDQNPQDRLNAERVIEAIKAEIKQYPSELGHLAYKNSKNVSIRKYLNGIAQIMHKQEKSAVVIIDGLDHVLKYNKSEDLNRFLDEIIFPQPGLWFLIGTQVIAKKNLPQIVIDKCPEDNWIEIKGLTKDGLGHIFNHNSINLSLPEQRDQKKELINGLYDITEGNPLHLRYSLKQLKDQRRNDVVTTFSLRSLLPFAGDIANYYAALWRNIPDAGKSLGILICSIKFHLTELQLLEVLRSFESNPSKITQGFNSIAHLLEKTSIGVSLFHASFEIFVRDTDEYKQQSISVKQKLKDWMESSEDEYLKWAELKILAYELGDSKPLLSIDRKWLIDAISYPREAFRISIQLTLAANAAFEAGLFGKTLELSFLAKYFNNAVDFVDETHDKIWNLAFSRSDLSLIKLDLNSLSTSQLQVVADKAKRAGKFHVIKDVIDIIADRFRDERVGKKGEIGSKIPSTSSCLLKVIVLDQTFDIERVHKFVIQFRDTGWSGDLFQIYANSLLQFRQFANLRKLLTLELSNDERTKIMDSCASFDLNLGTNYFLEDIENKNDTLSNYCYFYLLLKDKKPSSIQPLPRLEIFPRTVKEYEQLRETHINLFISNFYLGITYGLLGRQDEVDSWINSTDGRWSLKIMSQLFGTALVLSEQIKIGGRAEYREPFERLKSVNKLIFPKDRDLYQLQNSLREVLSLVMETIRSINVFSKKQAKLSKEELNEIISSKFYNRSTMLNCLLKMNSKWLADDAYNFFMAEEKNSWENNIITFPERTDHYIDLADLAAIHREVTERDELIELASNNFLGYGYHKDMYLDGVFESIELCHKAGSKKTIEWVQRIAPIIENVRDYTDGDETSHFPEELAELLVTVDTKLLYRYYYHQAKKESIFLAEGIFRYIISSLTFNNKTQISLAITALDDMSFSELSGKALEDAGANESLGKIIEQFGPINIDKNKTNHGTSLPANPVEDIDYSLIHFEALEERLDQLSSRWDRNKFLNKWILHWKNKPGTDKRKLYEFLNSLIEKEGLVNIDHDILDITYPIAFEFDSEEAFNYLCWAQANGSGWATYYDDPNKTRQRWIFLKENYPKRYLEFLSKSIYLTGKRYGRGGRYNIPIPRCTEFLILFNELKLAEEITEASIKFVEALMANMKLPISEWLTMPEVDDLDLLIQRLVWPSPLVRERAATGIAILLCDTKKQALTLKRLLGWIKKQNLESIVAVGLLHMLKAIEKKESELGVGLSKVIEVLPLSSVVIEEELRELCRLTSNDTNIFKNWKAVDYCPSNYQPGDFFLKYIKSFLAPVYFERAEKIKVKTGRDFIKQWSYVSSNLIVECSIDEEVGDAMDYNGRLNSPLLTGMSTNISEIYRSSFLRVLQDFYERGYIPEEVFIDFAFATLPVELSFWKIKPSRAPEWWPSFSQDYSHGEEIFDLSRVGLQKTIQPIINKKEKYTTIGLEGAVRPADGWHDGLADSSVSLVAFGYRVIGNDLPEPEEVREILYSPRLISRPDTQRPFNALEVYEDLISTKEPPIEIKDLIIWPLALRIDSLPIDLWQWYKFHYAPFGLSKDISNNLKTKLQRDSWSYIEKDRKIIARAKSWTEGISERLGMHSVSPSGNYLQIDAKLLDSYLKKNQLRLGYLMKETYVYRQYSYEKEKVIVNYSFYGVSKIII